jgi:Protein of unknown function (DUF3891)
MVLYPLRANGKPAQSSSHVVSAWAAVERSQRQVASSYWLIAQPDHAALAGDIAGSFSSAEFPALDAQVVKAISLHDDGWARFDQKRDTLEAHHEFHPMCNASGKPLSFFEIAPAEFTRAWIDSIERAEAASPLGGILVSKHFCRLGQGFMHDRAQDPGANLVRKFLSGETKRQSKLAQGTDRARGEIERLVDVLQFCDLLSLYLCCGSHEVVEFPHRLASSPIRLRYNDGGYRMEPGLIKSGASLGVIARRYPTSRTEPNSTTLAFLLS